MLSEEGLCGPSEMTVLSSGVQLVMRVMCSFVIVSRSLVCDAVIRNGLCLMRLLRLPYPAPLYRRGSSPISCSA